MTGHNFLRYIFSNIVISILIGSLGFFTGIFIFDYFHKEPDPAIIFSHQLKTLDEVGKNLTALQKFVSGQKEKLIESEKTLTILKDEEKKIRPVIEADRKTIEAIINLQSDIAGRNIWLERSIAFMKIMT